MKNPGQMILKQQETKQIKSNPFVSPSPRQIKIKGSPIEGKTQGMVRGFLIIICLLFIQPSSTRAGDEAYLYHLSQKPAGLNVQENTLIGYPQRYIVKDNDTLLDIARKFNLGFSEMKLMHKEIDPWIPPKGLELVIPTQWVLPEGNWFSPHSPRFHKMP